MNKTVSIALAGFSFVIEEHAYIKLNDYLEALRHTLAEDEVEEVMYDIEIRIAEIFKANLEQREIVSNEDVELVIAQIGTPEIISEQEGIYSEKGEKSKIKDRYQKQLFRDPEDKKIAGVCAGLAHYIGTDVSIMRWIWLGMLLLGIFSKGVSTSLIVLAYVVFWIIMPEAKTTSDILKMKGKPVDFDHIKEESMRFAGEFGKKTGDFYQENRSTIQNAGNTIIDIIRKVIGVAFAFVALQFLGAGVFFLLGYDSNFTNININGITDLDYLYSDGMRNLAMGLIICFLLILTLIFVALAVKMFSPKTKIRNFAYLILFLFALFIGGGIYMGLRVETNNKAYVGTNQEEENIALKLDDDVLVLGVNKVEVPQNFKAYGKRIFSDKDRVFEKVEPYLYITRVDKTETPYLIIRKKADGYNVPLRMSVPLEIKNNEILFPNYIGYSYDQKARDFDVSYELVLPHHIKVKNMTNGIISVREDEDFFEILEDETKSDSIQVEKEKDVQINISNDGIVIKKS